MFKHPYPVGYKATRWYARHHFLMEILEGAPGSGPVFRVRCRGMRALRAMHCDSLRSAPLALDTRR